MHTHVFGPNFQGEKLFHFNFLIQFLIYLETKLIIMFQVIIFHTYIIIAF